MVAFTRRQFIKTAAFSLGGLFLLRGKEVSAVSPQTETEKYLTGLDLRKIDVKMGSTLEVRLLTMPGWNKDAPVSNPTIGYQIQCEFGLQDRNGMTNAGWNFSFPQNRPDTDSFIEFQKQFANIEPDGRFEIISSAALAVPVSADVHHEEGAPPRPALVGIIQLGDLGQRTWLWSAKNMLGDVSAQEVVSLSKIEMLPAAICTNPLP